MRKSMLLVTLFLVAAVTALSQTPANSPTVDAEQAVKALTQEWLDAEQRHDRKTLQRIIAEDFRGTGPRGNTLSREDVLPDEGATTGGLAITARSILVRVFGETAVVTGHGLPKTGGPEELRFTIVFVKRGDSWQMVAGHLSRVPKQ
jgi:ketosteroid isomerase-like protein